MGAALANFLFFSSLSSYFLLPLYAHSLGANEAYIGFMMGIYNVAAVFLQPLAGGWVDRLGRRPFQVAGAALITFAAVAFAFTRGLGLLPFLRVLQGTGHSIFFVANYTFIADLVPPTRRGQAMGIFGLSGLLSTALAPTMGEFLIHTFGYHVFFLNTAVLGLLACLVSLRLKESGAVSQVAAAPDPLDRTLRLNVRILLPMLIAGGFGVSFGTLFTFLPTYGQALGVPSLSLFFLAYTLAALFVRTLGGGLIDRLGPRVIIGPALACQALGIVCLVALSSVASRGVGLVLVGGLTGTAHGFIYPALAVRVMALGPEARRGEVVGWFGSAFLFGNAAGAIIFGYIVHVLGYPTMFSLLAAFLCGLVALALRLER